MPGQFLARLRVLQVLPQQLESGLVTLAGGVRALGHGRVRLTALLCPLLELGLLLDAANEVPELLLVVEQDRANISGLGRLDGGLGVLVRLVGLPVRLSGSVAKNS